MTLSSLEHTTMKSLRLCVCALIVLVIGACSHPQAKTDFGYMVNNRYAAIHRSDKPEHGLSNFIGYCVLPLQKPDDPRGKAVQTVFARYLTQAGYIPVETAAFMHNAHVQEKTFLVGISYTESFDAGAAAVTVDLHAIEPATKADNTIWSWSVTLNSYPLDDAAFDPAVHDLFTPQPLQLNSLEPIFPAMTATPEEIAQFQTELARARAQATQKAN